MPEIQVPEIVSKLRRRFQLKGHASISTLAPELVPVIVVEDVTDAMEDVWVPAMAHGIEGATVNEYSMHLLANPVGSSRIIIIDDIFVQSTAAVEVQLRGRTASNLTNVDGVVWRDTRKRGFPTAVYSTGSNVAAVGDNLHFNNLQLLAGETMRVPLTYILDEGEGLLLRCVLVNTAFHAGYLWRERDKRADD